MLKIIHLFALPRQRQPNAGPVAEEGLHYPSLVLDPTLQHEMCYYTRPHGTESCVKILC